MKKILIIPSWYPTPKQPLNGIFFQEQAKFLQNKGSFDFRILYGEKKSFGLISWLRIFFQSLLTSTWHISQDKVQQDPLSFGFDIPANQRIPERFQIQLETRLYIKSFKTLAKSGWIPDLVHAQSGMDAGIFANSLSQYLKIPFVLIEHQVLIFHHYSRQRARLVLNSYKSAKKLAGVSNSQIRQLLMHEPNCKPDIIPNLVDENLYSLREKSPNQKFHVLTMMYANPIKGYTTFFKAMHYLKESEIDFCYTVVGKGEGEFISIAKDFDILGLGTFIEKVNREEISSIFQESDIYVCSSDFETFGIAPREAMMCGLPVVSTANGGVEDSITHDTGLVVPVRDAAAMADAILQVKENYPKYNAQAIRALAVAQCGRKAFFDYMFEFYQR